MRKSLRSFFIIFSFFSSPEAFAQFPYYESFSNSTASGVVFGGSFLTAGAPTNEGEGKGFLRLTSNANDQKGYIYSTTNFPSDQGLSIEFEYFTYGGTGADGITFFLFDATASPFNIGGFGGSLGYAPYMGQGEVSAGLSKGYLGIGLDEYGNFSNPIEGRTGGLIGLRPGSVTLRGSHLNNYNYLISEETDKAGTNPDDFSLESKTGQRVTDPSKVGYRKAYIYLEPNGGNGFFITVKILTGGTTATMRSFSKITRYYYDVPPPATLRYGIASSTGYFTNYHEIRNLKINAYNAVAQTPPVAVNDSKNAYSDTPVSINVLENDYAVASNTISKSSLKVQTQPTNGSVIVNPLTYEVIYTPKPGYTGTDAFTYIINDNLNSISNVATVNITVLPLPRGRDDLIKTNKNVPVIGNAIKNNDFDRAGTTVIKVSDPAKGTLKVNPDGTIDYTPAADDYGVYTFTYKLKNSDGAESQPVTVTIEVNDPPVANANDFSTTINRPVVADVLANDTDADGTLNRSSVVIKTPPLNGTVVIGAEGRVTYTPDNGFEGTDSFTYTVKDDDGAESKPAMVTITVSSRPEIGIAKAVSAVSRVLNDSYDIRYLFTIKNYGGLGLKNISLKDDLGMAFPGTQFIVKSVTATGTLRTNDRFNGLADIELLDPSSTINAGAVETVELSLNVKLTSREGVFLNTATGQGTALTSNAVATDRSTSGFTPDPVNNGDVSPAEPTLVELTFPPLFIPGGFSPNHDGQNDLFVIRNTYEKKVSLEVFNRWGNRVFKSDNYENNWDGKCQEGLCLGQDLPPGTYYYIIFLDKGEKYTGYITLNR